MDAKQKKLFSVMGDGVRLAFSNAEQLYLEGRLLREHGHLTRALFLHQISLEECGKVDMIGAWATNLFAGGGIDIDSMTKGFRSHEAKNYANAYFAAVPPEEQQAREAGDAAKARAAFRKLQEQFHRDSNTAKNASLYVDFKDGRFSSPNEVITEEMVTGIAAVNVYFLELTAPKVRLMERMQNDDGALQRTLAWFMKRAENLRSESPKDMADHTHTLLDELFSRYTDESAKTEPK